MTFIKKRTRWDEVRFFPDLKAPATGQQIIDALDPTISALNRLASGQPANGNLFVFGQAEYEYRRTDSGELVAGCWGPYPSANMVLLVNEEFIDPTRTYSVGTQFAFLHVEWVGKPPEHDLTMEKAEAFYLSVRRCAAGCFDRVLRQRGL